MTGMSRELPSTWRRWALLQCDSADQPVEQARGSLLAKLAAADFMPAPDFDCALRVTGVAPCDKQPGNPSYVPAARACEELLRAKVDAFAREFFKLPIEARDARFQKLLAACSHTPALAARLEALRPALDLPPALAATESGEVNELLRQARALFVLPRQERASRRLALLRQCQEAPSVWEKAAQAAQRTQTRIAALEPVLIRELSTSTGRDKLRAKVARQRRMWTSKVRAKQAVVRNSRNNSWPIWVGIMVVLSIVRGVVSTTSHTSPQPATPPFDTRKVQEMNEKFNKELREGKPVNDTLRRLYGLPPQQTSPLPGSSSAPPATPHVEFHVIKEGDASEAMRQMDALKAQDGRQRQVAGTLTIEQARDVLNQLRAQQAQSGPNASRDGMIRALEKTLEQASQAGSDHHE